MDTLSCIQGAGYLIQIDADHPHVFEQRGHDQPVFRSQNGSNASTLEEQRTEKSRHTHTGRLGRFFDGRMLCIADAHVDYWIEHKTFPPDEIAIRFHHRLVAIHPFPNGNGRQARLAADLLIERLGGDPFTWGGGSLANVGELRGRYVAALRAADNHDIAPLLAFARS
ncbi:fido (protein-threonine AMPylation protein) [Rhizobium petrolearium]|nr:fido (protein-threonine AMPylation protein) [Neorhizobium petrolearium]